MDEKKTKGRLVEQPVMPNDLLIFSCPVALNEEAFQKWRDRTMAQLNEAGIQNKGIFLDAGITMSVIRAPE
jgi:hypothetical protein